MKNCALSTKILLVVPDVEIQETISALLKTEGFDVQEAATGEEALTNFDSSVDLIILSSNMPSISGYRVCQIIREKSNVPVLFLIENAKESDLILGYSVGGDDYLTKPFSYAELLIRVKGLLRRYMVYQGKTTLKQRSEYLERNNLRLDCHRNYVRKGSRELNLTHTEYKILRLFMLHPRQLFSVQNIYEAVWKEEYFLGANNTVMVFMRKLRKKIEDNPQMPRIIVTIWGKGYRME